MAKEQSNKDRNRKYCDIYIYMYINNRAMLDFQICCSGVFYANNMLKSDQGPENQQGWKVFRHRSEKAILTTLSCEQIWRNKQAGSSKSVATSLKPSPVRKEKLGI